MHLYRRIVFGHIIATQEPAPVVLNIQSSKGEILKDWLD